MVGTSRCLGAHCERYVDGTEWAGRLWSRPPVLHACAYDVPWGTLRVDLTAAGIQFTNEGYGQRQVERDGRGPGSRRSIGCPGVHRLPARDDHTLLEPPYERSGRPPRCLLYTSP